MCTASIFKSKKNYNQAKYTAFKSIIHCSQIQPLRVASTCYSHHFNNCIIYTTSRQEKVGKNLINFLYHHSSITHTHDQLQTFYFRRKILQVVLSKISTEAKYGDAGRAWLIGYTLFIIQDVQKLNKFNDRKMKKNLPSCVEQLTARSLLDSAHKEDSYMSRGCQAG